MANNDHFVWYRTCCGETPYIQEISVPRHRDDFWKSAGAPPSTFRRHDDAKKSLVREIRTKVLELEKLRHELPAKITRLRMAISKVGML